MGFPIVEGPEVELVPMELFQAAMVGVYRRLDAMRKNRKDKERDAGKCDHLSFWQNEIEGAAGEAVVSKYLGLYWSGSPGELFKPDAGGCEVKTTPYEYGRLLIRDREAKERPDKIQKPWILVTGGYGRYVIRGWLWPEPYVSEGKSSPYWCAPDGVQYCWALPQDKLSPISELPKDETLVL